MHGCFLQKQTMIPNLYFQVTKIFSRAKKRVKALGDHLVGTNVSPIRYL